MRRIPAHTGFTLIEVLFALGLFALIAIPLLQTQVLAGNSLRRMERTREAVSIASAKLDLVQRSTSSGGDTSQQGNFQVRVTTSKTQGLPISLTKIQVDVMADGQVYASLSSYRL